MTVPGSGSENRGLPSGGRPRGDMVSLAGQPVADAGGDVVARERDEHRHIRTRPVQAARTAVRAALASVLRRRGHPAMPEEEVDMRLSMTRASLATLALVALAVPIATPASAHNSEAARAACSTYARIVTEPSPSASPRMESPSVAARPPRSGPVQAPGAGSGAYGALTDGELAAKSQEFQQSFHECVSKLSR